MHRLDAMIDFKSSGSHEDAHEVPGDCTLWRDSTGRRGCEYRTPRWSARMDGCCLALDAAKASTALQFELMPIQGYRNKP